MCANAPNAAFERSGRGLSNSLIANNLDGNAPSPTRRELPRIALRRHGLDPHGYWMKSSFEGEKYTKQKNVYGKNEPKKLLKTLGNFRIRPKNEPKKRAGSDFSTARHEATRCPRQLLSQNFARLLT